MTLYERLKQAGIPIDHHHSDLYVPVTIESTEIIRCYAIESQKEGYPLWYETFQCEITGMMFYDIAFHYQPYWERNPKQA